MVINVIPERSVVVAVHVSHIRRRRALGAEGALCCVLLELVLSPHDVLLWYQDVNLALFRLELVGDPQREEHEGELARAALIAGSHLDELLMGRVQGL